MQPSCNGTKPRVIERTSLGHRLLRADSRRGSTDRNRKEERLPRSLLRLFPFFSLPSGQDIVRTSIVKLSSSFLDEQNGTERYGSLPCVTHAVDYRVDFRLVRDINPYHRDGDTKGKVLCFLTNAKRRIGITISNAVFTRLLHTSRHCSAVCLHRCIISRILYKLFSKLPAT